MFDIITQGISKLLGGGKSERDVKELMPYVSKINQEFEKLKNISDDDLRQKTIELKQFINEKLKPIIDEIQSLHQQIEDNPELDINEKDEIFKKIDALEKEEDSKTEDTLLEILPQAFAVVKETARRFTENKKLVVKATDNDLKLSTIKSHIKVENETATWYNKWMAAGSEVEWNMVHYDVQLIGGIVLHKGKIAEMATGEGKTLVATLPAYLNALTGKGVHIVTVNNYLAKRDSEWNAPIFEFHGLKVSCIDDSQPHSEQRKEAYKADIIYGTNNEFGFDYLRDNMGRTIDELVQRKHHFAMVDEVDSVLIDDARTPLIISGPIPKGNEHEFNDLKPKIYKLVEAQKKIVIDFLNEAKKHLAENKEKEGGLALFRAYRGLPKNKPLIKFLSESGIRQIMQKTENFYLQDNQRMMPEADKPLLFIIDEKNNSIDLTEKGIDLITNTGEDTSFFILPDIAVEMNKLDADNTLSEEEKLQKKDKIILDYNIKSKRIHSVNQLLKAYCLFEKDVEYIVVDGKVKIVDEQTGRVMEGRRYSDGLHQAIEAKENVKIEDATQTYATITLQNFFRMYHKLAGMTGTAETEAGEFWDIYKLDVVVIPTNKPIVRKDLEDKVYKTVREKFNAVIEEINQLVEQNRPVLVGTTSVEISEILSRMLTMKKIKHQVLNAKQHAKEADIVAQAGMPKTVTIATNMAGRGTDIKLTPESRAAGGLAIVGTERHESRRVDRQLRGRSGRQGDVGSSQFFVSLEDNLMRLFGSDRIAKIMDRLGLKEGEVIQHSMITKSIERAQKKVEENNFGVRKRLLEYDNVMNSQREVIYKRRKNALYGERLQLDILNMMYDSCEDLINNTKVSNDVDELRQNTIRYFGLDYHIDKTEFEKANASDLSHKLYEKALEHYKQKNEATINNALPKLKQIEKARGVVIQDILIPFTDGSRQIGVPVNLKKIISTNGKVIVNEMEKMISLAIIDLVWKEHLREMDDLKQSVQNAVYEQKDPLLIYKFEGFELFKRFIGKVNLDSISFLIKAQIPVQSAEEVQEAKQQQLAAQKYQESKEESRSSLAYKERNQEKEHIKVQPITVAKLPNRNDTITVRYNNGLEKSGKYKHLEKDINNNQCVIVK